MALTISLAVIHPGLTCCQGPVPLPARTSLAGTLGEAQIPFLQQSSLHGSLGQAYLAHSHNSEFIYSTNKYLLICTPTVCQALLLVLRILSEPGRHKSLPSWSSLLMGKDRQ